MTGAVPRPGRPPRVSRPRSSGVKRRGLLVARSYDWNLWGAAYLMKGGCSDDAFDYFRGWLVAQGRRVWSERCRTRTRWPNSVSIRTTIFWNVRTCSASGGRRLTTMRLSTRLSPSAQTVACGYVRQRSGRRWLRLRRRRDAESLPAPGSDLHRLIRDRTGRPRDVGPVSTNARAPGLGPRRTPGSPDERRRRDCGSRRISTTPGFVEAVDETLPAGEIGKLPGAGAAHRTPSGIDRVLSLKQVGVSGIVPARCAQDGGRG